MKNSLIRHLNSTILRDASRLSYTVSEVAPNCENDLFNASSLVVWNGSSDNTIFQDPIVNWAFRAIHDTLHLKTRLDFSPMAEIELGRIQASKYTGIVADLMFCEVAGQAMYFLQHGVFVPDQVAFTKQFLKENI